MPTQAESGNDGDIVAEHQPGVVLAKVPDGLSLDEFNARIAQLDFLAPQSIAEDSLSLGWAELVLADGVGVQQAMSLLESSGVAESTQPNYVYHLVEADNGTVLQPGSINGDLPPNGVPTGVEHSTLDYYKFVDDPEARNQMVILTVRLKEAYNYLFQKGYVSEVGYGKDKGALRWLKEGWRRPTVAILDTGCQLDHPDLRDNLVGDKYYDAVYPDAPRNCDIDTHGTHVAGIVAAVTNNATGVTGVSLNAGLLIVNVFDNADSSLGADSKDIAAGYEYVIDHAQDWNVRVVNLSLGSSTEETDADDKLFLEAIEKAYQADILTVIASGNDGSQGAYTDFPSDFAPNAVSVIDCAVTDWAENPESLFGGDLTLTRDYYSNFNKFGTVCKQLSALGSYVMSTVPTSGYENKNGTSMASPCVAGVAALALQVNPNLTVEQLKSLLYSTADDVASFPVNSGVDDAVVVGFDAYSGFGTVNAYKAVVAADAGAYLSVSDGGQTTIPVLGKGVEGASTVKFAAPVSSGVTWDSSNANVASVDGDGLVTAQGTGQAIISASYGAGEDAKLLYTTVTVRNAAVSGAEFVPHGSSTTLQVIEQEPIDGALLTKGTWFWTSSDPDAVSVEKWSGVVTGKTAGSTAVITASLVSNPAVKASQTVRVGQLNFADVVAVSMDDWTYDGTAHQQPVTVRWKADGSVVPPESYAILGYSGNKDAGTCTVTVAPTDTTAYAGTAIGTCTVSRASLSGASIAPLGIFSYTGEAITPEPTITIGDRTLADGVDYELSYQDNVAIGVATVTAAGIGNYADTVSATFSIAANRVEMLRLYNPNSGEHFYTASVVERDNLVRAGWRYEGSAWIAPSLSSTPVFRLYNPNAGDHHYTMSAYERDQLKKVGWRYEGVGWYSDDAQGVPLHRLYNPNAETGTHHYTTSTNERDSLVRVGWCYEGVAWHGLLNE